MEPIEAPLKQRTVWAFQTSVKQIYIREGSYWVHLEGSRESMFIGADPGWKVGDKIKVTMEKVDG